MAVGDINTFFWHTVDIAIARPSKFLLHYIGVPVHTICCIYANWAFDSVYHKYLDYYLFARSRQTAA